MKKILVLLLLLAFSVSFAQSVNDYKYALVPSKFAFLKEKDEYRLNSLTKFLMEKYGFVAYLDTDDAPEDFLNNNCNKIYVDVISVGNMFKAKLKVTLSDCQHNVLFTSNVGGSKYKDYKEAYNQALREAFDSFVLLQYHYKPKAAAASTTVVTTKEVVPSAVVVPVASSAAVVSEVSESTSNVLFAQPIANGFQLVDNAPKVVMKIYKTSVKDYFTATKGNLQGVLLLKENNWYFEYYQNEKLVSEKIEIKF